jgi:GNAT superfamily N-acetyltransferase
MVLGNGGGTCALAADALQRESLQAVEPSPETAATLARSAPAAFPIDSGIDLVDSNVEQTVAAVQSALDDSAADSVLLVHSPVIGHPHAPLVSALGRATLDARLMTVWLGLHTAQAARRASGQARLATFGSVDEAARAIRYRRRYHENRKLLSATPPPDPTVTADITAIRYRLSRLAAGGAEWLSIEDTAELLTAYRIANTSADQAPAESPAQVRFESFEHPELGMLLRVTDALLDLGPAYGFPPLDPLLARRMLEGAGVDHSTANDEAFEPLLRALVRLSKLVVDLAEVTRLDLNLEAGPEGRVSTHADTLCEITSAPRKDRDRLAMSPYPARMRHRVTLRGGRTYVVRAIRPSDEPMLIDLLESLSLEEVRLRFFSIIRKFSHDMAARMTQIDYDREVSLVASSTAAPGELAATATIIADPDGEEAEYAILVHHDHTSIGLGRHLLDCLLRQAHARGITTVYGDVLTENRPMLELVRRLGFTIKHIPDDPSSVRAEIDVARYRSGEIEPSVQN